MSTCQNLRSPAKIYSNLPKFTATCQNLRRATKICGDLPKFVPTCQYARRSTKIIGDGAKFAATNAKFAATCEKSCNLHNSLPKFFETCQNSRRPACVFRKKKQSQTEISKPRRFFIIRFQEIFQKFISKFTSSSQNCVV